MFETAGDLEDAYQAGELRPFEGIRGMRLDRQAGELAKRLDTERRLYRGLRPEAYELAVYLAAGVRDVSGTKASLTVTSTVRDLDYQRLLVRDNVFATREYSLHTTGFAFDVRRDYAQPGPGRRVPVHARPAAVAQPDRVGARAGRDPHHRLERGGRAGSA